MLNIFIIDHRPVIRFGIRYFLEHSMKDFRLHDFSSVQEAGSEFNLPSPNLIFLGAEADSQHIRILPEIKKAFPNGKLIIYDLDTRANEGIKYLRSGAHGYLSKMSDLETIKNCIQVVMDGKFFIDPKELHLLLEGLVLGNRVSRERATARRFVLTPRQNEIASLFAVGMSTSKIAKKLGLSSSTISTVKSTIYDKLKIDNIVDLREAMSC